jgi:LysR family transcriptional regulator for metE and metH
MATRLSIRQLQMITVLEQTGSVSKAAVKLNVSQSALSHRIREAERLLSTTLFLRQNRTLLPTNAGKRIQHAARRILWELERAEQDIAQLSEGVTHTVRIGLEVYCGVQWLPKFEAELTALHPGIGLEVMSGVSLDPLVALRRSNIDLAVVSGINLSTDQKQVKLGTDQLLAVLPHGHVLAQQEWLEATDFATYPYIAYHTNPEQGREYDQVFSRFNMLPPKVLRAGVTEAVLAFIASGRGLTMMPGWTINTHSIRHQFAVRPITAEGLSIDWYAVMQHGLDADSIIGRVVDILASRTRFNDFVEYK